MSLKNNLDYVTAAEAAQMVGVTADHLRRMILRGKIKAEKLGRNWVIKRWRVQKITRQRFPKNSAKVSKEEGES